MRILITILFLFNTAFAQKIILGINKATSGCVGVSGISFCNKASVFVGNSITKGTAPVNLGSGKWTALFCAAKNCTEVNYGIDGQTRKKVCKR